MSSNLGVAIVGAVLLLSSCTGSGPVAGPASTARPADAVQVRVLAAFYPYHFVATRVGGTQARVELLTRAGVEPHDLELSPRQVEEIGDVDLIIYQHGFQPAVDDAVHGQSPANVLEINTALGRVAAVDSDEHPPAAGDLSVDPHVWLDADKLAEIATATAEVFSRINPSGAPGYRSRAAELRTELGRLDEEFRAGLRTCNRRNIVVNHAAFGHLAARYGLTQVPVNGITPAAAPSPARLAELAALIRRQGATTVYTESLASPRLAQTLAAEAGVRTATLDPLESLAANDTRDYLSVMRDNLTELRAGLDCAPPAGSAPPTTADR